MAIGKVMSVLPGSPNSAFSVAQSVGNKAMIIFTFCIFHDTAIL